MEIQTNSHGTNLAIKFCILSDSEMRKIGFTDNNSDRWYYWKFKIFPHNLEISFDVTILKDGSDMWINVLDEDFLQPYDYQKMMDKTKRENCELPYLVNDWVESQMKYLQNTGVLNGHIKGEYI